MPTFINALTDAQKACIPDWNRWWIDVIMSTERVKPEVIGPIIRDLYEAAGLEKPKHVVVVPSPLVLCLAGPIAAGLWWLSRNRLPEPSQQTARVRSEMVHTNRARSGMPDVFPVVSRPAWESANRLIANDVQAAASATTSIPTNVETAAIASAADRAVREALERPAMESARRQIIDAIAAGLDSVQTPTIGAVYAAAGNAIAEPVENATRDIRNIVLAVAAKQATSPKVATETVVNGPSITRREVETRTSYDVREGARTETLERAYMAVQGLYGAIDQALSSIAETGSRIRQNFGAIYDAVHAASPPSLQGDLDWATWRTTINAIGRPTRLTTENAAETATSVNDVWLATNNETGGGVNRAINATLGFLIDTAMIQSFTRGAITETENNLALNVERAIADVIRDAEEREIESRTAGMLGAELMPSVRVPSLERAGVLRSAEGTAISANTERAVRDTTERIEADAMAATSLHALWHSIRRETAQKAESEIYDAVPLVVRLPIKNTTEQMVCVSESSLANGTDDALMQIAARATDDAEVMGSIKQNIAEAIQDDLAVGISYLTDEDAWLATANNVRATISGPLRGRAVQAATEEIVNAVKAVRIATRDLSAGATAEKTIMATPLKARTEAALVMNSPGADIVADNTERAITKATGEIVRDGIARATTLLADSYANDAIAAGVMVVPPLDVHNSFRPAIDATTRSASRSTAESEIATFLLRCIGHYWDGWHGGNQWASWLCYLSFWRDVCDLELPSYEKYRPFELAGIHGGPRYMHRDFCMVSDRPEVLRTEIVNGNHRLHCEDGPSCRWPDGWSLWYIHGVAVDEQTVLAPETQTIEQIDAEKNEEARRVRIERYGWEKYLHASKAEVVHQQHNARDGQVERLYRIRDGRQRFVCIDPSTGRRYALGVPRGVETCQDAQDFLSHGLDQYAIHRS